MRSPERVYRTADGAHTLDPEAAAFLAFAAGDELPGAVVAELGLDGAGRPRRRPADKARPAEGMKG